MATVALTKKAFNLSLLTVAESYYLGGCLAACRLVGEGIDSE